MTFMLSPFEVADFDTWKRETFDADPAGRKQAAKSHRLFRGVENPNEVFVGVEFGSVAQAESFREQLKASGVLDTMTVKTPPTVVEVADEAVY